MTNNNRKILLVEDDLIIAMDEVYTLRNFGYEVIVAHTGEKAVSIASEDEDIDLILMDINLGKGIDGTEAARQILSNRHIPIVFLTSHSEKEFVDKVREITRYGYILKNSNDFVLQSSIDMAFELFESYQKTKENEELYRITLNSIGDAVIATDTDGIVTGLNPIAQKITGWKESEAIGKPLEEVFKIINEITRKTVENPVIKVLREGLIVGLANHTLLISKDGMEVPIADSGAPIKNDKGEITGVVLVFRDQSDDYLRKKIMEFRLTLSDYSSKHTLRELLTKILDEIGELLKSPIGFYHFINDDQISISLQAWSSNTIKKFCNTKVDDRHYSLDNAGVWVDCVKEKKPVIHNNYESLENKKGLPEGHVIIIRELVVPVFRNDKIVAIMGVGNKSSDYTSKDVEIADYIADVTWEVIERKRAEEQLQESRRRYQEIFEGSRDGFVMVDSNGRIIDANPAFCFMLGYSMDELIKMKDFYEITPKRWREWEFEEIWKKRLLRQGYSGIYEKEYIRKDGTVFPVELQSYCVFDEDNNPDYLWGIARDITERKQAEEKLTFQARVLNQIQDRITVTDLDGYITYINDSECRMLGISKEEIIGNHVSIYGDNPEIGATQDDIISKTLKEGQWRGEVVNYKSDGSFVILDSRTYLIKDKDNNPIAMCGISTDITEQKNIEKELIENKNRLNLALHAYGIGIWDWNTKTGKVGWSTEHASLFGISLEQFDGYVENIWELIHPDDSEELQEKFQHTINTGEDIDITYRVVWPDGNIHWLNSYGKLINDDKDEPKIIGITHEVTKRVNTERALKRANDIINRSPVVAMVWKNEENWPVEYVTDNVKELFGWNKEDFLSISVSYTDIIHPDDLQRVSKEVDHWSNKDNIKSFIHKPYRIITKNGEIKWLEDRTTIRRTQDGSITAYEGILLDITERVDAEESYIRIWNMVNDLICVADINTATFLQVNPSFEKTLGFSEHELLSKPFLDFVHPDDVESTVSIVNEKLQKGVHVIKFENRYRRKDGSYCWLDWNSHPIPELGITYAIAHDITKRKEDEEKIKKLLDEKDIILQEVHHRIKNNMSTIVSLLKLQASSMKNPDAIEALCNAQRRVRSMQVLYDKLYRSTDFQKTSLKDYLETLIHNIVSNFLNRKEIIIEKNINDITIEAKTIFTVGIIVNEILTNTMKYAFNNQSDCRINISTSIKDKHVKLIIQDNGIGIPEWVNFENSSGFGLNLVNILSKQIDAEVKLERIEGTKFTMEFDVL